MTRRRGTDDERVQAVFLLKCVVKRADCGAGREGIAKRCGGIRSRIGTERDFRARIPRESLGVYASHRPTTDEADTDFPG
jgi:hypothetical protein